MNDIVIGDAVYTEEMVMKRAREGGSIHEMLKEIQLKRERCLFAVLPPMDCRDDILLPKATKTKLSVGMTRVLECFYELQLRDRVVSRNLDKIGQFTFSTSTPYIKYTVNDVCDWGIWFEFVKTKTFENILMHFNSKYSWAGYNISNKSKVWLKNIILVVPEKFKRWEEENDAVVHTFYKAEKARNLTMASIRALVDGTFKGSNFEYSVQEGNGRAVVAVGIGHNRKLEIRLTEKGFQDELANIIEFVEMAKDLSDYAPTKFRITNKRETIKI